MRCPLAAPESVTDSVGWLMGKGRKDRARNVLVQKYQNVPEYDIDYELSIIEATIERQRAWSLEAKAHGPLAIFKGLNGKRFLIGSWPKVLQQFVGLSIFSSYSASVFPAPNVSPLTL